MRLTAMGSMAIAMLAVAGCERNANEHDAGSSAQSGAAASAPEYAAPREAKASADAAGLSTRAYAPEFQTNVSSLQFPTSFVAADSLPPAMIIRTGTASIEVDSLDSGIAAIRALAAALGGYLANTSMQAGNAQVHAATLQLRLPSARFDDALAALRPIGKLESTNVNAEDVGEEYVDVSAQVANGRKLEQRLIQILATRTGKLADVLSVERELARVRGEIDRQEGRLRYLRAHTAMSTLAVTVHEPLPIVGQQGSGGVLAESFRQSWRNFVSFVASFIAVLGTLVPLMVLLGLVAYGAARGLRRVRQPVPVPADDPGT